MKQESHRSFNNNNQYESDRSQWPGTPPQAQKEEFRRAAPPKRAPTGYEDFGINTHRENYASAFGGWKSKADIKFSYERYRKASEKPDEDVDMVDVDGSRVRW